MSIPSKRPIYHADSVKIDLKICDLKSLMKSNKRL